MKGTLVNLAVAYIFLTRWAELGALVVLCQLLGFKVVFALAIRHLATLSALEAVNIPRFVRATPVTCASRAHKNPIKNRTAIEFAVTFLL